MTSATIPVDVSPVMASRTPDRLRVRLLTRGEQETLLRWVKRSNVPETLQRRARVILLSSYDISAYVIALLIPMGRNNVTHWIRRFNQEGLAGLRDRPRPGRPRRTRSRSADVQDGHAVT